MTAKLEVIPVEEDRIKSLPTHTTIATIQVVEDLKTFSTHHIPSPPNGPINGDVNTSTAEQETPMNLETPKQVIIDDIITTLLNGSELDFDSCTLPEVIGFLQRMAKDPHTSTLNIASMEHITNALIKAREEKLKLEVSIPRNLEDGWDPRVKIKLNNFSCFALCDVGASASVMPKRMYDMLELRTFDSSVKKPLGRIGDVLILSMIIMFPLIFLSWTLSVTPRVQSFWDVLFFAPLVLSLI